MSRDFWERPYIHGILVGAAVLAWAIFIITLRVWLRF